MKRTQENRRRQAGFTLVEIMVVIVILGMLVAIVAPNVLGSQAEAETRKARIDVIEMHKVVTSFFVQSRRLPESMEELVTPDDKGHAWLPGYDSAPKDPWDNEYQLIPGEGRGVFEIVSWGPDGLEDTDDDISSKNAKSQR